jgi:GntR family transcriptional regulator of vanillate catabolism
VGAQQERVVIQLREMILRGELKPGERVAEIAIAAKLGMSRTPVRQAFPLLAREGLLSPAGARGYVVRQFSEQDVVDAIEVRGVLEGLAARMIAERGPSRGFTRELEACLADGDAIFARRSVPADCEARYAAMNVRFHKAIVAEARSTIIADALSLNDRVPFAAAGAVAHGRLLPDATFELLRYAHHQHHAIAEAFKRGESGRVDALMREHVRPVIESLNLAKREPGNAESAASGRRFALPEV